MPIVTAIKIDGTRATAAMNCRAREGDAGQDAGQVALGLRAGADTEDEATLLADGVGLLGRVERDRRVEVGEADDHQAEEGEYTGEVGSTKVPSTHSWIEPQNPVDGSAGRRGSGTAPSWRK